MPVLSNSDRSVLKATYVPLKTPLPDASANSGSSGVAMVKTSFARNLRLQAGEVDQVRATAVGTGSPTVSDATWQALKQFEPQPLAVLAAKASTLANIASDQLLAAGRAILAARTQQLKTAMTGAGPSSGDPAPSPRLPIAPAAAGKVSSTIAARPVQAGPAPTPKAAPAVSGAAAVPIALQQLHPVALASSALTSAVGAINAFENAVRATPIGMLHLERVEMVPAGIERGELVATIPLAPGETTSVEQKEWTVTSQEFSSIVTDFLENYSEKGVTEKTELAESTESQTKHSQQLGLNASVSGSYGFVTFSTNASFNTSSSDDESKKASRNHATEVTEKASTRVRKEHKVTIQTSSVTGTAETSTRTLTNPSSTDTMRIDYFSMMRKWRVRLLRYGVRMTYDLAIPEPGATLRAVHAQLADLNAQLNSPFTFQLDPSTIDDESYAGLAASWGVSIEPPPAKTYENVVPQPLQSSQDGAVSQTLTVEVQPDQQIVGLVVGGRASTYDLSTTTRIVFEPGDVSFHTAVLGPNGAKNSNPFALDSSPGDASGNSGILTADLLAYHGMQGSFAVPFVHSFVTAGSVYAIVSTERTDAAFKTWQQKAWQTIHDAARDAYYTQLQATTQQRDALKAEIENVDTLTLRREEREEIMKGLLRWLLGPEFDFMPQDVQSLFYDTKKVATVQQFVEKMAEWFVDDDTHLTPTDWSLMYSYGEMVKFIMEAIEWENLLYILYPYFWDIPFAWDFVRRMQHPDSTREAFLRAGSARVVLTIRPGWEDDFLGFLENGEFGKLNHPYMTISDEMKAYANTNYPGIPPANPETSVRPLLTPSQRKAWQDMQGLMAMLDKYYNDNNQTYPTTAQGLAALAKYGTIPGADPWGKPYIYSCPGQYNDYDLSSLGADAAAGGDNENADITSWANASLIGEWFEYTPSHGLDIAVASNPADLA